MIEGALTVQDADARWVAWVDEIAGLQRWQTDDNVRRDATVMYRQPVECPRWWRHPIWWLHWNPLLENRWVMKIFGAEMIEHDGEVYTRFAQISFVPEQADVIDLFGGDYRRYQK